MEMSFRYVLKDSIRGQASLDWYLVRGWEIVGTMSLGGWDSYIMRKVYETQINNN